MIRSSRRRAAIGYFRLGRFGKDAEGRKHAGTQAASGVRRIFQFGADANHVGAALDLIAHVGDAGFVGRLPLRRDGAAQTRTILSLPPVKNTDSSGANTPA